MLSVAFTTLSFVIDRLVVGSLAGCIWGYCPVLHAPSS